MQTQTQIEESLRKIVGKIAETTTDFPLSAHLRDDLNVDSVRALEIVFDIEKVFAVSVPEGRYGEARTFQDLVNLVVALKS